MERLGLLSLYLKMDGQINCRIEFGHIDQVIIRMSTHLTLPGEIGNFTHLTSLTLSFNRLSTLPPEIGNLTALQALHLNNNHLTSLPSEISNLTALTTLNLSNNRFSSLPPEIGQLTALTTLNLKKNKLTALPPEIAQLNALTLLVLLYNPLESPWNMGLTAKQAVFLGQEILLWSLPDLLTRLTNNKPVTEFDRRAPTLSRNYPFLLEKVALIETPAARTFQTWLEKTFALKKGQYQILL